MRDLIRILLRSLIYGGTFPQHRRSGIMATIQDRLRIPWRGGAKQISADTIVPVLLVPALIFIAAFDLILSILALALTPILLWHAFVWFRSSHPKSKFFVIWAIVSFLTLALIFEIKVIALLEILPEENVALGVMTLLFLVGVYYTRRKVFRGAVEPHAALEEGFCATCKRKMSERTYHCSICQVCVPERDFHFIWLDCCIGHVNNGSFILTVLLAVAALLYSSNLTLTTVCHPFNVYETILLPDDCSEVYEQYDMAVCFVCAVYSMMIAFYLLWVLARQLFYAALGVSGQEYRQLPASPRSCCGIGSPRPYSRGVVRNLLRLCLKDQSAGHSDAETF